MVTRPHHDDKVLLLRGPHQDSPRFSSSGDNPAVRHRLIALFFLFEFTALTCGPPLWAGYINIEKSTSPNRVCLWLKPSLLEGASRNACYLCGIGM